jgi:retinol-binding protein 3
MRTRLLKFSVVTFTLALMIQTADFLSARAAVQTEEPLTSAARNEVIETILKRLNDSYVFPDVAKKMEQAIRERVGKKEYDTVKSGPEFAKLLTEHLQAISHDKHLRVAYSVRPIPVRSGDEEPTAEERAEMLTYLQRMNFGFEKVERMPGNIGYLQLNGFAPAGLASDTAVAAMSFLQNTDALIVDLRQNGGGDPAMVAVLCSYLFDKDPVHLNDIYSRPENETRQFWTLQYLPGKRYTDKPVYVLTSKRTFSGAEEFTYNLKNLKRATIIGETTGGGANPGGSVRVNEHFGVFIPTGRAISPITKTNWEGTGVTPDIAVPAEAALQTAQIEAIKHVLKKDPKDPRAEQLNKDIERLQREIEEIKAKKS